MRPTHQCTRLVRIISLFCGCYIFLGLFPAWDKFDVQNAGTKKNEIAYGTAHRASPPS